MGTEDIDADEVVPITHLPFYIPPTKSIAKVTKDPNSVKFQVSTPMVLKNVPSEGNFLARIPYLKMEDWDLGDHAKFP